MHIERLKLVNFRNYKNLNIDFGKNFNVIYGENAQGKTNILEAIFLCASGRSHRTSKDSDLIKMDESIFLVKVDYKKENSESSIEIIYEREQKKKIKINDIPVKKIGSLMGNMNTVIFSPEDILIIKEGPSERRRFIDITLSQLKPSYFYDLQQYLKILHQRNTLLKNLQKSIGLSDTLEAWNDHLINVGSRIMMVRNEFIKRLNAYVYDSHMKLAGGKEQLEIRYAPSIHVNNYEIENIKKSFKMVIEKNRSRELLKQTTLFGPQRDDYEIQLNGTNLKLYGSQGQQRTSVLSIKLAEMEIMKEDNGEYPVLLLDDVMSELDSNRQKFLMDNMKHIQTFITCTDIDFFEKRDCKDYSFFKVKDGEIIKI